MAEEQRINPKDKKRGRTKLYTTMKEYCSAASKNESGPAAASSWKQSSKQQQDVVDDDDYPLDTLQALNTTLCFLASVNVDIRHVENFVVAHPESLLLDGAGTDPDESAKHILHDQMRQCSNCCNSSSSCNRNRAAILQLLSRGFEYYHQLHCSRYQRSNGGDGHHHRTASPFASTNTMWDDLVTLESEIRELRNEEMKLKYRSLEMVCELRHYDDVLEQVRNASPSNNKNNNKLSALSLLTSCHLRGGGGGGSNSSSSGGNNKHHNDINDLFARQSVLEYQVGVASVNLASVEREHRNCQHSIRARRKLQFKLLLKKVFERCKRHVCTGTV